MPIPEPASYDCVCGMRAAEKRGAVHKSGARFRFGLAFMRSPPPARHRHQGHCVGRGIHDASRAFGIAADTCDAGSECALALLWQNLFVERLFKDFSSAVRTPLSPRPQDEIDDGMTYCGHGWLRRRPVDSFFSAPRVRGDGVARRCRRSWSLGRDDEDLAMIALRSDQVRAPPSTADAPAHKSILP